MKYFAVIRVPGPSWDTSLPMRRQKNWKEHAEFMDGLADEGFVVLGGPLGKGEKRFLLIFRAESEKAIRSRLAADPWTPTKMLRVTQIKPWEILLGETE